MDTLPQTMAYIVQCSTGCSCCRADNETRGPWATLDQAQEAAAAYTRQKLLSSQYAPNGCYEIRVCIAEQLPDGRLILDNTLVARGFLDETDTWCGEALLSGEQMHILPGIAIANVVKRTA
jgi:hypothetical protein